MKRQNVRTLSLIVVTFTYLLLGAAIFDAFESNFEGEEDQRLKQIATALRTKYNMSQDDFHHITQLGIQMKPYKAGTQWKFAGAFYFATTVITTIGYGHSTPKTTYGKIFCMCYAIPGIPLCLVMFQSIGERMNTIITWLLKRTKKLCSCKCGTVSQTNLMLVSFTTGAVVLTLGAAVFSKYEDWSYLDSFYYCFITLTTIGFGDFVALQRNDSLARRPDYVAFSLIFILFGLTVVSSVMNLLVLRFLTMNTEDEKRDQLEAAAHAQELQRLHGDVIWSDDKRSEFNENMLAFEQCSAKCANFNNFHSYDVDSCSLRTPITQSLQRFFNGISNMFTSQSHITLLTPFRTASSHPLTCSMDLTRDETETFCCVSSSEPNDSCCHRPILYRSQSLPNPTLSSHDTNVHPRYSEVVRKTNVWVDFDTKQRRYHFHQLNDFKGHRSSNMMQVISPHTELIHPELFQVCNHIFPEENQNLINDHVMKIFRSHPIADKYKRTPRHCSNFTYTQAPHINQSSTNQLDYGMWPQMLLDARQGSSVFENQSMNVIDFADEYTRSNEPRFGPTKRRSF